VIIIWNSNEIDQSDETRSDEIRGRKGGRKEESIIYWWFEVYELLGVFYVISYEIYPTKSIEFFYYLQKNIILDKNNELLN
jgi:hypothetical protein